MAYSIKKILSPGNFDFLQEEYYVKKLIEQSLKPNSNCIDVGAHIGSVLSIILKYAPNGNHVAFEPGKKKAGWLSKKFPEVQVFDTGAGDKNEVRTFSEDIRNSGFSGFGKITRNHRHTVQQQVRIVRIDDVVPKQPIDFIKIDVEGFELYTLMGAHDTIKQSKPVLIFESGPSDAENCGYSRKELYDFVTVELGMKIYRLQDFFEKKPFLSWGQFNTSHEYPLKALNYIAKY